VRVSPDIRRKWQAFRRDRRARWSVRLLAVLFLACLPAELLCNARPLAVRFAGRWFFPAFARYTERDFGGTRDAEPDYQAESFRRLVGRAGAGADAAPCPWALAAADAAFLARFDPEPEDVAPPAAAAGLLARFDPEADDAEPPVPHPAAAAADPHAILDRFDPEPEDRPLPRPLAPPSGPVLAAAHPAWVLWAPVRSGYDTIAYGSRSGRDALAAPFRQRVPGSDRILPSSWIDGHWLGTDDRGRDVLARLVYGFRVSFLFGLALAASSLVIGTALGALQGYFGGWLDLLGQRLSEIWGSLPRLYLLMILSSLVARNVYVLFFILNLTSWMGIAQFVRAEFLRARNFEFVRAARALGVSRWRIMARHLLPNCLTPIITFLPFTISGGMLALASLDFLGLGVPPPYPSLGELLAQGQANLQATWIIVPTFLLISGTITLLTFVTDGVRNAFDPRQG
jgi:microcin C transport system permease protein